MKLVDVINNQKSVVELYLSDDGAHITEVKCLTENRCKEYRYPINEYFQRAEVSRSLKNKIALALAN
jgi:hypothetical protein